MNAIKIVAETEDTVTIDRAEWARLLAELEDAEDRAAIRAGRAFEAAHGRGFLRENSLSGDEARRLLDGESPVRVWRGKRGLTQRALAAAAGIAPGYLADIEAGRKSGSAEVLSRLARALRVSIEDLMDEATRQRDPDFGPVWLRYNPFSVGIRSGGRGPHPTEERFASVREAWARVRAQWATLKNHSPAIVNEQRLDIFSQDDLWRELEPDLFASSQATSVFDAVFEEAGWSRKLASFVAWTTLDGEQIRCRVREEVFRDCLGDGGATFRDFARLYEQYRPIFERAFRKAIHLCRFSFWQDRDAGRRQRREIVLSSDDFQMLAGP
jgi:mRNA interferase RelE/StbE